MKTLGKGTLVEDPLETGRKHQIRVQLSQPATRSSATEESGARQTFPQGVACHGRRMELVPIR